MERVNEVVSRVMMLLYLFYRGTMLKSRRMKKSKITDLLYKADCILGESPLWHAARSSCIWLDIYGNKLFEYTPKNGVCRQYDLPILTSYVGLSNDEQLILASPQGVHYFVFEEDKMELITDLGGLGENYRCNDGAIDSKGRLWIGTTAIRTDSNGSLYMVDSQGLVSEKLTNIAISNGIAWSSDNQIMYHIDSLSKGVDAYIVKEGSGDLERKSTPIHIPDNMGLADGMTIDRQGNLWIALYGGYGVAKFSPDTGEVLDFVEIPCPNVTSCCFVGPDLDALMITTAQKDMDATALSKYPLSGSVFVTRPTVPGVPIFKYSYKQNEKKSS